MEITGEQNITAKQGATFQLQYIVTDCDIQFIDTKKFSHYFVVPILYHKLDKHFRYSIQNVLNTLKFGFDNNQCREKKKRKKIICGVFFTM